MAAPRLIQGAESGPPPPPATQDHLTPRNTAERKKTSEEKAGYSGRMSSSQERAARNELLFRDVNGHIEELAQRIRRTGSFAIVCECSHRDCLEGVEVDPDAYRAVRSHPLRFLLSPGHEEPDIEHVIERTPGYIVVEKTGLAAAAVRGQAA